jgi:hypothetical protein
MSAHRDEATMFGIWGIVERIQAYTRDKF